MSEQVEQCALTLLNRKVDCRIDEIIPGIDLRIETPGVPLSN
jgi:hypothetical protein